MSEIQIALGSMNYLTRQPITNVRKIALCFITACQLADAYHMVVTNISR